MAAWTWSAPALWSGRDTSSPPLPGSSRDTLRAPHARWLRAGCVGGHRPPSWERMRRPSDRTPTRPCLLRSCRSCTAPCHSSSAPNNSVRATGPRSDDNRSSADEDVSECTGTTHGSDDSGGDCESHYHAVAPAPTWAALKAAMLGYEERGRVASVRTQARGTVVGAGRPGCRARGGPARSQRPPPGPGRRLAYARASGAGCLGPTRRRSGHPARTHRQASGRASPVRCTSRNAGRSSSATRPRCCPYANRVCRTGTVVASSSCPPCSLFCSRPCRPWSVPNRRDPADRWCRPSRTGDNGGSRLPSSVVLIRQAMATQKTTHRSAEYDDSGWIGHGCRRGSKSRNPGHHAQRVGHLLAAAETVELRDELLLPPVAHRPGRKNAEGRTRDGHGPSRRASLRRDHAGPGSGGATERARRGRYARISAPGAAARPSSVSR